MTPDAWAAATALISCVVLVLNYLRERGPHKRVTERLDELTDRVETLEKWRNG